MMCFAVLAANRQIHAKSVECSKALVIECAPLRDSCNKSPGANFPLAQVGVLFVPNGRVRLASGS